MVAARTPGGSPLPARLRAGIRALSGLDLSDVSVLRNSRETMRFEAAAFARESEIHLAPGEEWALPHEAWHLVQQRQGRVRPTRRVGGAAVNDSAALEREADAMGGRAASGAAGVASSTPLAAAGVAQPAGFPVAQLKGWRWTGETWEEVDPSEPGPPHRPPMRGDDVGSVYDTETGGLHRSVDDYRAHTARFASPAFNAPESEAAASAEAVRTARPHGDPRVGERLRGFATSGVLTPARLGGEATSSSDQRRREGDEISVNVFAPTRGREEAARVARHAATNRAAGALPVVMERHGDEEGAHLDEEALSRRAHESAVAVIRPDDLAREQQQAVRSVVRGGGGEATLHGGIPASNFARLLVPAEHAIHFSAEQVRRHRITFVGSKEDRVAVNTGGLSREQPLRVPDYESALRGIFEANPESTFLTHAVRLSPPGRGAGRSGALRHAPPLPATTSTGVERAPERDDAESQHAALPPETSGVRPATAPPIRWERPDHVNEEFLGAYGHLDQDEFEQILPPAADEPEHRELRRGRFPYRGRDGRMVDPEDYVAM